MNIKEAKQNHLNACCKQIKTRAVYDKLIESTGNEPPLTTEFDHYREQKEDYITRVENDGFKVIYPKDTELFIDIDSEEQYQWFLLIFERLKKHKYFSYSTFTEKLSKSGLPKRHVYVELKKTKYMSMELSNIERILLQAVLGSDPHRELLSYFKYLSGDKQPTLFCEIDNASNS